MGILLNCYSLGRMNQIIEPPRSYKRHLIVIIGIALTLMVLEITSGFPNVSSPFERLELISRDLALRMRGGGDVNDAIVIAAIDDESLAWVGERWPWRRSQIADIINWLNDAGAKLIAVDIILFEESFDPAEDEALLEALNNANSVVTVSQIFSTAYKVTNDIPHEVFLDAIDGYGITEIERGDDAIVRGIKAFKDFEGQTYYNWAFEVSRVYLGIDPPSNPTLASLNFRNTSVPLNNRTTMLIDFAGPPKSFPTYPAAFIPLGDYDSAIFKDKIVFIGATSETLQDLYPTPYSSTSLTPGVEVIANAVSTILSENYLRVAPPIITLVLILGAAILAWFIIKIPQPTLVIVVTAASIVVYFIIRQVILIQTGTQLAIIIPMLMLFLGTVIPTMDQAVAQEVEKRRISGLFGQFISPQMVEQLINTQDINSLNKRTEITILFSDIRGFTSISERLSPEEVVNLLNPYLEEMTKIIYKYGGTVDKYEGDAIIAFFGEPIPFNDHAKRATQTALEMRDALKNLTRKWKLEGRFNDVFEMGVGINTGEVFVGLIGSEHRINYTIIGDAANLAARLQDETKVYNWPILISGDTFKQVKNDFAFEFADSKILKGKSVPVDIYKLLGKVDRSISTF